MCLADDIQVLDGLECGGGDVQQGGGSASVHFTCKACFSNYIKSLSEKEDEGEDLHNLEYRGGTVLCPKRLSGCTAPAFSDAQVGALCAPNVFKDYVERRVRVAKSQLASEMARDHAKKLEAELGRLEAMDERWRR